MGEAAECLGTTRETLRRWSDFDAVFFAKVSKKHIFGCF